MKKLLLKYKRKSETELLGAYLKGDELAFCELYMRHTDKLVGFFMVKCRDRNLCNDLVQNTFCRLLDCKAFKGNSINEIGNYIMRIAFNVWSEYAEKQQKRKNNESKWAQTYYVENDDNINKEFQINILELAINQLPSEEQIAAIKLWQHGKSYQEIADVMGKTIIEITNLIYRAKRNLRRLTGMLL